MAKPATGPESRIRALGAESVRVKQRTFSASISIMIEMATVIHTAFRRGNRLLLCGNGGSAADAQHLAAEMVVRLRPEISRDPLPAMSLALDPSSLTACGNDLGFETYYARMVTALGRPGDVLLAISTSGRSPNIVSALDTGRALGLITLGLLGSGGGLALKHCDHALVVPSSVTGRVQETHITVGHAIMELVEDLWLEPNSR